MPSIFNAPKKTYIFLQFEVLDEEKLKVSFL